MTDARATNHHARLRASAEDANRVLDRCCGDGSILDQVAQGARDQVPTDLADAWADSLDVLSTSVKHARIVTADLTRDQPEPSLPACSGPNRLPLNRKERYFTGTVFPAVVAADSFAHLPRLLRLCGLDVPEANWVGRDDSDIQLFTEYGFAESVFTPDDKKTWPEPATADTPDIVIATKDMLLAIEAKMYHRPNGPAIRAQMTRQATLIGLWRVKLGLDERAVRHVALLPAELSDEVGDIGFDIITWQELVNAYEHVGPDYWVRLLRTSLQRYDNLASLPLTFKGNATDVMTGSEILDAFRSGTPDVLWVGRSRGAQGKPFSGDVADGSWRTRAYEVSSAAGEAPNSNWMSISTFVAKVSEES